MGQTVLGGPKNLSLYGAVEAGVGVTAVNDTGVPGALLTSFRPSSGILSCVACPGRHNSWHQLGIHETFD